MKGRSIWESTTLYLYAEGECERPGCILTKCPMPGDSSGASNEVETQISSRTDQIDTYSTILPVGADFGTHGWLVVIAIDHRH